MPENGKIIVAGHGRIGGLVSRVLTGAGHQATVIDFSSAQLAFLKQGADPDNAKKVLSWSACGRVA
jgi:prephenate dehydrogenase